MDAATVLSFAALGVVIAAVFGKFGILAIFVLWISFGIVSMQDQEDDAHQQTVYCKMTETWAQEAKAGVPVEDRTGWPPYDGECNG